MAQTKQTEKAKPNNDNWMHSKEVEIAKEVVCIDRKDENAAVEHFQKTGDLRALESVYVNRIPTIRGWAHKHYYPGLTFSVEDLFEDLSVVFVKAAEKYDKERGSFNTCLYTFLDHRLKNIKNAKHAKKRLPEEYKGPAVSMVLSLDFQYNSNDGTEVTLKDVIPANNPTETDYVLTDTYMEETLDVLARNNEKFRDFLKRVGEGNSLVSLIREYKTRNGYVRVNADQAKRFSARKCNKMVSDLLKQKNVAKGTDFTLTGYKIEGTSRLRYEIELNKTQETDMIMRSLRELRKNKAIYKKRLEEAGV